MRTGIVTTVASSSSCILLYTSFLKDGLHTPDNVERALLVQMFTSLALYAWSCSEEKKEKSAFPTPSPEMVMKSVAAKRLEQQLRRERVQLQSRKNLL